MERMRRRRRPGEPEAPPEYEAQRPQENGGAGSGVQVIWGATADSFDLAEMTVGDAYRMLSAPLNIAPAVAALVNGNASDANHRLAAGDVLEFARPAGEKGARA
ncbi:MAG: hypothetical protein V3U03_00560 [Myxococcota bacterium]